MDNWCAVYGLALVFCDEEVAEVFKRWAKLTGEYSYDDTHSRFEDEDGLMTNWEAFEDYICGGSINGPDSVSFVDESEGDGQIFLSLGNKLGNKSPCYPEESLVLWANKEPNPFKTVYPGGLDELIEEFKHKDIAKCVPEDFNWGDHIGYYSFARCY